MRKITVCAPRKLVKMPTHSYQTYKMVPGSAWKFERYGQHEVVTVDEAMCKKADHVDGCTMQFDGRQMAIFTLAGQDYLQPMEEHVKATDDRLGKKRKIRKLRKPRKDAPGVAPQAVNAENDGPEPAETPDRPARRTRKEPTPPGEVRSYRRAGPRRGLTLA